MDSETSTAFVDIFVYSTGNSNIITLNHMKELKNNAFIGNTATFVNEIDLLGSEGLEVTRVECVIP